jgi:hypothetical protein
MLEEKRRYQRVASKLPVKMCNDLTDVVTETQNISGNGAYCMTDKEIDLMTKLNITLLIPVKKTLKKTIKRVNCQGVVVRKEYQQIKNADKCCLGIYFNEIKESDRKIILNYIKNNSMQQVA